MHEKMLRKKREKKSETQKTNYSFNVQKISPKTLSQEDAFDSWKEEYNLFLHGIAGTGKTFLALYFACKELLNPDNKRNKIYIVRSAVPTRDVGALPGNLKEKTKVYESPYYDIFTKLFGRGDAYDNFKNRKDVEFVTTSYIRGITLDNCVIVVDECQSMNFHELDSIITRIGENCKIFFCGDVNQNDLIYKKNDISGLVGFMKIIERMEETFDFIEFTEEDIVRSDLVKDYIITKNKLGL